MHSSDTLVHRIICAVVLDTLVIADEDHRRAVVVEFVELRADILDVHHTQRSAGARQWASSRAMPQMASCQPDFWWGLDLAEKMQL